MMNMNATDVKREFEAAFGKPVESLTTEQVRFLADCGRHMRGRCRSNTALVNWLNSVFPSVRCSMVKTTKPGEDYQVLSIMPRELPKN